MSFKESYLVPKSVIKNLQVTGIANNEEGEKPKKHGRTTLSKLSRMIERNGEEGGSFQQQQQQQQATPQATKVQKLLEFFGNTDGFRDKVYTFLVHLKEMLGSRLDWTADTRSIIIDGIKHPYTDFAEIIKYLFGVSRYYTTAVRPNGVLRDGILNNRFGLPRGTLEFYVFLRRNINKPVKYIFGFNIERINALQFYSQHRQNNPNLVIADEEDEVIDGLEEVPNIPNAPRVPHIPAPVAPHQQGPPAMGSPQQAAAIARLRQERKEIEKFRREQDREQERLAELRERALHFIDLAQNGEQKEEEEEEKASVAEAPALAAAMAALPTPTGPEQEEEEEDDDVFSTPMLVADDNEIGGIEKDRKRKADFTPPEDIETKRAVLESFGGARPKTTRPAGAAFFNEEEGTSVEERVQQFRKSSRTKKAPDRFQASTDQIRNRSQSNKNKKK